MNTKTVSQKDDDFGKHAWMYATVAVATAYIVLLFTGEDAPMAFPFLALLIAVWSLVYSKAPLLGKINMSPLPYWLLLIIYPYATANMMSLFVDTRYSLLVSIINDFQITVFILAFLMPGLTILIRKDQQPAIFSRWRTRLQRIPLFTYCAVVVTLLAMLLVLSNNYFVAAITGRSLLEQAAMYLLTVVQIVAIYLPYYLIYHWHHKLLFNKLLKNDGIVHYGVGIVALLLLFTPTHAFLAGLVPASYQYKLHSTGIISEIWASIHFSFPFTILVFSFPFIALVEWSKQSNQLALTEKEKTQAELNLLKQQINPHFFFNTLNNLYAMSLTEDQETPEAILKLSDLMRYVIYQGSKSSVPIESDIAYLQDYVALQKLRYHQSLDYRFDIEIEDEQAEIAPLLLVILVENAFKHGLEPSDKPGLLHLKLEQKGNKVNFSCHNSIDEELDTNKEPGIGLENLRRRLSLTYPDRHQLSLSHNGNHYIASLDLAL